MYEEEDLQELACSKIPVSKLKEQAEKNSVQTKNEDGVAAVSINDCLLLLLLEWFKSEYRVNYSKLVFLFHSLLLSLQQRTHFNK